jgi:hypothetical protein
MNCGEVTAVGTPPDVISGWNHMLGGYIDDCATADGEKREEDVVDAADGEVEDGYVTGGKVDDGKAEDGNEE